MQEWLPTLVSVATVLGTGAGVVAFVERRITRLETKMELTVGDSQKVAEHESRISVLEALSGVHDRRHDR